MAERFNLSIDAGATYDAVEFKYLEDDGVTPVDLTGWTVRAQLRKTPSSSLALAVTPSVDIPTGVISLVITAAQTSTLTESEYVWALEAEKNGVVIRLVNGKAYVSPEVVR
jgi:hypothetical protein